MRFDTALITGASSGIGEEFGHQLAPHCRRLVLVARRRSRLQDLARSLRGAYPGLDVHIFEADLANAQELESLVSNLAMQGLVPDLLVNNAGLGDYGEFATARWDKIEAMLKVNIRALTRLCHAVVPAMRELGGGSIINVSSLASVVPIPDFAVYAATKAYVTSFSEALRMEVRAEGIRVLALCPGPVPTEFGDVARRPGALDGGFHGNRFFAIDAGQVVEEALQALAADKARHFPGLLVAATALAIGLLALRAIMGRRPRRAGNL
jgi:short-subunit dehydrogenase